ncbi:MAG: presenilin family intramembrane aspartyl protease [Candidatus Aenigmatarchaeota archaeon]|nr:hypothetical protein [Nanoarchaeota archaeon]
MKHNIKVVGALVILFLISQIVGLALLVQNMDVVVAPTGEVLNVTHADTVIGPRPEVSGPDSLILVLVSILIGTGLLLFFIKIGMIRLWKIMFFLAIFMTVTVALGVVINAILAAALGLIAAILKIYKSNVVIHNMTEIFIYSGIALIFVDLFARDALAIVWVTILLLIISVYDFIAVFKSKHMISIAKFQTGSRVFAGLSIPYTIKSKSIKKLPSKVAKATKQTKTSLVKKVREKEETIEAILGGGDIAFPLIFAGVVLDSLIRVGSMSKLGAFLTALIIPIVVSIFLLLLFIKGKKGKYYPAMPVLTAGCLLGYAIILLI